jgi:anti-anti-sigma factor
MNTQSSVEIIKFVEELDIGRRDEVRQALQVDVPGPGILIDCADVTYTDSTIIVELIRFYNDARALKRPIAILIGDPQFDRILEYSGFSTVFPIFTDRAKALTYLAKGDG